MGRAPCYSTVVANFETKDENRDASRLPRNAQVTGAVASGKYAYYKVLVVNPNASVRILLKSKSGDPDLFVGNLECPCPTKESHTWRKSGFGDDKLTVNYFDENFRLGWIYIGVHGAGRLVSEFSLSAAWQDPNDKTQAVVTIGLDRSTINDR